MDEADALLVLRHAANARRIVFALALAVTCCAAAFPAHAEDDPAQDVPAGTATRAVPEGWAAATAPDSATLVSGDWRLTSPVFSEMPAGGYQIRFSPGGRVSSENLAGVTGWTLVGGRLLLYDAHQRITYQFQWNDDIGIFQRHLDADEAGAPPIEIVRFDRPSAREVEALREAEKPFVLPGAVIGTADDARRIALQAYFRAGGVRALQSVNVAEAFRVGADVAGFAHRGDFVWEARIHETGDLSAIIWVHAGSGATCVLFPRREEPEAKRGR